MTAGTRAQSPLHDESCSRDPENWRVPGLVHSAVHRTSPHITAHRSQSPQTMRACRSSTPRRSTLGAQAHTQRWPLKTHVLPSSKRDGPQTSIPSNMMQAQPRCSSSPLSAARIVMTAWLLLSLRPSKAEVRDGRGCKTRARSRVAPELRTRRRGPRLGQHANALKCTGETTLEVVDGTLLERQSGVRALEPVLVHVTREEEDHDRNRVARRGRDWQEIVGSNDRTCAGVPSGECIIFWLRRIGVPGTQLGSMLISTRPDQRLCLGPL